MRLRMHGAKLALLATLVGLAGLVCPATARAQAPDRNRARDEATARILFDDARALMRRRDFAQACPKLEAARKLKDSSGVLLNLGDCYEQTGRTGSAFAAFGDAAAAAARQDRLDDETEARRRQVALEPKLSRLVVRVVKETRGLVVKDNDHALERATWGVALPVDPGPHVIAEEAPGFDRWSTSVDVPPGGKRVEVEAPELKRPPGLELVAADPDSTPTTPDAVLNRQHGPTPFWTTRRQIAVVAAGVGVAALGISGALAGVSKSKYDAATQETAPARRDDSKAALAEANAATGLIGVGAALAATAVILFWVAPGKPATVVTDGRGLYVTGRF